MSPSDIARVDLGNRSHDLASRQVLALSDGREGGASGASQRKPPEETSRTGAEAKGQGQACLQGSGPLLWSAASRHCATPYSLQALSK